MKTLKDFATASQLNANIIRSEINNGRTVFLCQIEGTDRTMITSQPATFGCERVKDGIGIIDMEGEDGWQMKFSKPIDEINSVDDLPEFKEV